MWPHHINRSPEPQPKMQYSPTPPQNTPKKSTFISPCSVLLMTLLMPLFDLMAAKNIPLQTDSEKYRPEAIYRKGALWW